LKYLDRSLTESLRYHGSLPLFARTKEAFNHTFSSTGVTYRFPEDWLVVFLPSGVHKAADMYAKPFEFDPSHFADTRGGSEAQLSFMPFGSGPSEGHKCLGYSLERLLSKVLIIRLYQYCDYELLHPTEQLDASHILPAAEFGLALKNFRCTFK